ncbi:hypothetical protein EJB05_28481, partial [Eragrostis curvula]
MLFAFPTEPPPTLPASSLSTRAILIPIAPAREKSSRIRLHQGLLAVSSVQVQSRRRSTAPHLAPPVTAGPNLAPSMVCWSHHVHPGSSTLKLHPLQSEWPTRRSSKHISLLNLIMNSTWPRSPMNEDQ